LSADQDAGAARLLAEAGTSSGTCAADAAGPEEPHVFRVGPPAAEVPPAEPAAWEVEELAAQNAVFERRGGPAADVVAWVANRYRPEVVLACSFGVEDCALVDIVSRHAPNVGVFYLDTQLLFPETYATRDRLIARYGLRPVRVLPRLDPERQAEAHGPALWRRDPDACCRMRKVEPLAAFLRGQRAWISGVRREQSPTRATAPFVEWDRRFGLAKANPLAVWTGRDVWRYVQEHDVPYNPLHDQGFPSIGCWPCTRAVRPGEDPRAGRWAGFDKTECGLHK
jgi:phosphoadenosine phosphosulfate reductase